MHFQSWQESPQKLSAQPPTAYIYTQVFIPEIKALKRNRKWIGAFVLPYHFLLLPERQAEEEISTGRQGISAGGQAKQHPSEQWWLLSVRFVWLGIHFLCNTHLQSLACHTFQDKRFASSVWATWAIITLSSYPLWGSSVTRLQERQELWPSGTFHWTACCSARGLPWSRTSLHSQVRLSSSDMALGNLNFADVFWEAKENTEYTSTELLADLPQSKPIPSISGAAMVRAKWSSLARLGTLTPLLEEAFLTNEKLKLELVFTTHLWLGKMSVVTTLDHLILYTVEQTSGKLIGRWSKRASQIHQG